MPYRVNFSPAVSTTFGSGFLTPESKEVMGISDFKRFDEASMKSVTGQDRTRWNFKTSEAFPHPSEINTSPLYKSWVQSPQSIGLAAASDRPLYGPGSFQDVYSQRDAQQLSSQQQQDYYGGGGGGGLSFPSMPQYQEPPRPALPPSLPPTPVGSLNLPESPNYYQDIDVRVADPYRSLQPYSEEKARLEAAVKKVQAAAMGQATLTPQEMAEYGISGTPTVRDVVRLQSQANNVQVNYLGEGYWDEAEGAFNQHVNNRQDYYGGLQGNLVDHYSGLDFNVPDYYGDVNPITGQHYRDLDPTSPDYYSNLQNMIDSGDLNYEELSEEEKTRLAEEYAGINVDPQLAALRRYLEQTELDAESQSGRIQAAYAPVEAALARRESAQADRDLEGSIARGGGRSGAVEWKGAERDAHYTEQLVGEKGKEAAELTAIANQLGLTQRQIQERMVDLEALRGQLTSQELKDLRDKEYDRMFHGQTWKFEASMQIADRLTAKDQWSHEQSTYIADRLTQIDQFNSEQAMGLGDRRTALDQWMKEMGLAKADRLTALEQWEKNYDLEVAHRKALDDQSFREWEVNTRMSIGDRKYEKSLQEFNLRMGLADRTYQQSVDQFSRELLVADRMTQRDIDQMARALDVYDRTQLTPAQQYQLWITMAEVAGVFPDRLPGT